MIQDTPWTPPFVSTTSATAASTGEAITGTSTTKFVTPAALAGSVPTLAAPVRNALAPDKALSFNGTAGSTIGNLPAFGTGDFSFAYVVNIASFADSNFLHSGDANAPVAYISTSGSIVTGKRYGADNVGSGAGSVVLNTPTVISYTRSGTTGKYYVNGLLLTTITDSLNYAAVIAAVGKQFGGTQFFSGTLRLLGIANRALSAAEVLAVCQNGSFPASDYGASGAPAGTTVTAGAFVIGKKYRIVSVGTTSFTGIGASANTVGVEFTATGVGTGTGTALVIGLLVAPDPAQPGNGLTWGDRSGNGAHILLPTSGVDWLLPSAAVNKLRGTTSTSGNQQLLGGTTLNANTQITRVRARSRSGTPSITLGTASGGSQIVASVALSTTWKDLTIALTGGIISTASSVWVGSSTADVVEIDLTHEPLGY